METSKPQLDLKAVAETLEKIHYYSFIPKHIKYSAYTLEMTGNNSPSYNSNPYNPNNDAIYSYGV